MENHVKRMLDGARVIKMRTPSYYTTEFFESKVLELCQRSGILEGGRCRLSLDRVSGGSYLPESNECTFYIEVYPYDVNHFELNAK